MEGSNWRPAAAPAAAQGDPAAVDASSEDWRSLLHPDARQRIVNKIMETLKRHLPVSVPEGLSELKKIALRFEEKIYTAATNQSDYLRRISVKMLSMETKTQGTAAINPSPSNPGVGNPNPADSASIGMQPQVGNQGQSLAMPLVNQSQVRQQLLPQNLQNNSVSAASLASIAGLNQSTISNVGQTSNMQNMSGVSQNSVNNSVGQGATQSMYANAQRQMQGRQQQAPVMSQQQQHSQNQLIYQQQLQQQLLNKKIQHSSLLQQQQQQQSLLQPNQLQSSQQPLMQMASSHQTGQSTIQQAQMQSAPQSGLQQNQQNSIQQSIPSLLQQHSQSISRQQAQPTIHQQSSSLQQQSAPIPQQQSVLPSQQQQQQLMGQQSNMSNMQQNQLLGQQNNVPDMQQQQPQRLPGQHNNLVNMQQPQQMLSQQTMSLHQQQQLGSQNNLSGMQQQQLGSQNNLSGLQQQQQQQLLGSQSSVSSMQPHQRSLHMLQQTKSVAQQQNQQSLTLLHSQGQQSQHQSSQQQLISQIQSQTPQLQQQLAMQQQPNSLQREMQQRLQASGMMLQSPNTIEQQKQFIQSQRGLSEVSSSTSMDSTVQTGHAGVVDWQEEIYQKIKSMKESYFAELNELNQRISSKFQQHEALTPPAKQSEQYVKMKQYKYTLERTIAFLQIPKNDIQLALKDKLPLYEKQIATFLASSRSKKVVPSQPQGQQQFPNSGGHAHSMQQQQPSQVSQLQQHDSHVNPNSQQMNMQGSVASMQSAAASSMQHGSVPLSTTQQNIANGLQPATNLDPIQGNSFSSLQQGSIGSVQQGGLGSLQNTISAPQQTNINTLSQGSGNSLQSNVNSLPPGSNVLQHQHLKQQQQEQQQLMQTQQMKQQLQQRQIQFMQQQQKQQILQPPPMQQLHQQKQQQAAQMSVHQMSQLHQMNDINELKARQGSGIKSGIYQQHFPAGQRHNYYHQQLKAGTAFPLSSPQNLQASSPQISQHSSPQVDQHTLLPSHPKAGTPLQSANSPFVVPSPSTPTAPSPIPGESEKISGISSLQNTVSIGHQQTVLAPPQPQSLAVGTPGISASPLLAEFISPEVNVTTTIHGKPSATERPLERLVKAVQSLSAKALSSSINDIGSVVSMIDRIAGSAPGNGSRAAVGEDLVAMTKCRLQARSFISQDGSATTKKMKRHTSAMPLNAVSSAGSVNDSFKQSYSLETSELESTATSNVKRQKIEVSHALLEEIREINQQLIDTVVSISDEDVDSIAASFGGSEGTVVKFSFSAVSLSPNLKAQFASAQMSPIVPLRLLVPVNYPKCSPVLVDKLPIDASKEYEDLSVKAQGRFCVSLRCLSQPMSLGEMAMTWDVCARKVIEEYARQSGGGSFTSRYGAWESCVSA